MVGPPVSAGDRLRNQHVPLVSPSDEDIVQQVPPTRPRMPPGGLLSLRQTEERVRQDETVFGAGSMVCADAALKPPMTINLSAFVEFFCCGGVGASHRRSGGADDGGELAPTPKRQTEAHQATVDALRQAGQSSHDVVPMAKATPASRRSALGRPLQKKV
nr:unnamed protein product [Spirometra erinaceieuropaei]